MAVKEEKKETCRKVKFRRAAVTVHPYVVSSPPPRALASRRSADGVPPITTRPISPLVSTDESDSPPNTSVLETRERKDRVDHQGLTVDWILDSSYSEVSRLLTQLDIVADSDLIIEMVLHYSLVIKGLPDCPEEDLHLAVYFFVEDTFSIRSRLVQCRKLRQYDGRMDVGVVFDTIRMKYDVLRKDSLLEGTEVRIVDNKLPRFGVLPRVTRP